MTFHSALGPLEMTVLIVATVGAIPIAFHYRDRSRWFVLAYGLMAVGALSTNVENLFLGDALNFLEHSVGLMGSSLAFAGAAYLRRRDVLLTDDREEKTERNETVGSEHSETGGA